MCGAENIDVKTASTNGEMIEHNWIIIPPTSLYDDLYRCSRCGEEWLESYDDPSTVKPKFGCER